jgi:hypothetical protein
MPLNNSILADSLHYAALSWHLTVQKHTSSLCVWHQGILTWAHAASAMAGSSWCGTTPQQSAYLGMQTCILASRLRLQPRHDLTLIRSSCHIA